MMIPINWGNNVDVQHTLHFDLDPSMTAGQGHKTLRFCEFRCLTGSSLCSLLLRNYSTDFSNDDTNQLRKQCRCATCTSFWPWPPPPWLQVKVTKYLDFVNLDVWRVVVCVRFSSETTRPNSPILIPIYRGNNVDLQHILHFDLYPEAPPWLQVKVIKYFNFVNLNLDVWWVVVCVRFSSETTRPISPMMMPINWGNNVDVQYTFTLTPPWLQVKVMKYFNFVNSGCCLGMNANICRGHIRSRATDLIYGSCFFVWKLLFSSMHYCIYIQFPKLYFHT